MNPAERIMRAVARHLTGPAYLRLLGGAAMILGYGRDRYTEDADLLMLDEELEALIETADLGVAVGKANEDLDAHGLYLSHIWGPEHQILTPEWRTECRTVHGDWAPLRVEVLGPVDLVLSKLCRADEGDLADIGHLIERENLDLETLELAFQRAMVPEPFVEVFPRSCTLVRGLYPEASPPA